MVRFLEIQGPKWIEAHISDCAPRSQRLTNRLQTAIHGEFRGGTIRSAKGREPR